ncbi:signal peptidase II [Candidatus Cytomitobacter primus]|nr:signal peptidase II [Candidatus Cytomitobacter primus]
MTLFIVFIDQMTKRLALHHSFQHGVYSFCSFLKVQIRWNYGLSFSICSSFYTWVLKFIIISACLILLNLWYKVKNKFETVSYSLILGGGISNLIDRFLYNAVLDFISVNIAGISFPVFNIADIAITIGVAMLVWKNVSSRKA